MNNDNRDKAADIVQLRVVLKAADASNADQLDQLFKQTIATKTIVQQNVCLFIDGYYFFKNLKKIRNESFRKLIRTSSIPNRLDGQEIRLDQIPKPLLVLHDLNGTSKSQLRDISFTLIDEARHKICDEIQQNLSRNDAISYSNIGEIWEKCRQVSRGEIQQTVFDKITHVLKFNFEVRVFYAVLDASFYESQLEKRRRAERIKEIPDLEKIKSIREAMDALTSLKIISKPKLEYEMINEAPPKSFSIDVGEYYEFIQSIRSGRRNEGYTPGYYQFSIVEYGVSDFAKFKEKQVDVGLAVAAAEKIFDNEKVWSIGIVTGDTDYLPIFRKSVEKGRSAFLLAFESISFAYRKTDFEIDAILLGAELDRYVRELENTRVQRLYQFIGALTTNARGKQSGPLLEKAMRQAGLGDAEVSKLVREMQDSQRLVEEYILRHIDNCEKLYGTRPYSIPA